VVVKLIGGGRQVLSKRSGGIEPVHCMGERNEYEEQCHVDTTLYVQRIGLNDSWWVILI
jgi:hypothetical protein